MMALPNYKDIVDLVKKGATVEAQEKIMELREGALELQEENIALRDELKKLQEKLDLGQEMEFRRSVYYRKQEGGGEGGPYCPTCFDANGKIVHLHDCGDSWQCMVCNTFPEK